MSDKTVYCGIAPLKKGQRYGSMAECAEKKQVRRYGQHKMDPRVMQQVIDAKQSKQSKQKVFLEIAGLSGMIDKAKRQLNIEKNPERKKELRKQITAMEAKRRKLAISLN